MSFHSHWPRALRRFALPLLAAAGLIALAGCVPRRLITTPMQSVLDLVDPWKRSDTLLVLLPGAFDQPNDFIHEGFIKAVRERQIAADIQLLDAHTEYYTQQIIVERLLTDVVRPARDKGYRTIWLAGISLGGHGSLLFAKRQGDLIDGVFVMAAYLGRRDMAAQVASAGGLARWQPDAAPITDAFDHELWRWLRGYVDSPRGAPGRPPLYVGYGTSDRFAASNETLAQVLPPDRVFTTEGGHNWGPWLALWSTFLDRAPLPHLDLSAPTGAPAP